MDLRGRIRAAFGYGVGTGGVGDGDGATGLSDVDVGRRLDDGLPLGGHGMDAGRLADGVLADVRTHLLDQLGRSAERGLPGDRLAAVGFVWAFATTPRPGPAQDHYRRRRERGDRHAAALRHLFNRMLGQLYHCLQTGQPYDETRAYPARQPTPDPVR